MRSIIRRAAVAAALSAALLVPAQAAWAASRAAIEAKVERALAELRRSTPEAAQLLDMAKGVLIMPDITKAGLLIGGAYGEGALQVDGRTVGYYSLAAGSFGLQIGVRSSKQALFFMTDAALDRFRRADGWEIGAEAALTGPGGGLDARLTTTETQAPVIAVTFGEDGLLAGAALEGAKYSPIERR